MKRAGTSTPYGDANLEAGATASISVPSASQQNTGIQIITNDLPNGPNGGGMASTTLEKNNSWESLLSQYPGHLPLTLAGILKYGCQIRYQGPLQLVLSKNLKSSMLDPFTIKVKLLDDLKLGRILSTSSDFPFISSPLGLVPKGDGGFRRIHHLSHPRGSSVNDFIPNNSSKISYISIKEIYTAILTAGQHCTIIKKDIADAFRNIPVATDNQWLLGFQWEKQFYKEACLSFGLATALFLFNLFAEGFHWILQSWLQWTVFHYLDDFVRIIPCTMPGNTFLPSTSRDRVPWIDFSPWRSGEQEEGCHWHSSNSTWNPT